MRTVSILALAALLALSACSADPSDHAAQPAPAATAETGEIPADIRELVDSFDDLELITPKPYHTTLYLAAFCRDVPATEIEQQHGPHASAAINIYMNDTAAAAHRQSHTPWPVGSVIIKEKRHYSPDSADAPNGLGGMIKRPAGYDPDHGDWEYFYAESQDPPLPRPGAGKGRGEGDPADLDDSIARSRPTITTGRIATCVQCHAKAAHQDHVFASWAVNSSEPNEVDDY